MALIQRYTTELSTHAGTSRQIHNDAQSVEQVLNDVATIKRQDEDEKRYLHSLNDRLEELLRSLDELEIANKKLRDDLNLLITNWGIGGENRIQFLKELDEIIRRLGEQNRQKIILQAETKLFDEQNEITDRVSAVFIDVLNLYRDKCQIIFDLTNELEEELRKIRLRLDLSNAQLKSHDDDYQKELAKFRSYLAEWSQLALDKQYLLNEIQSLKERYNLRLAYNQEEIKEWQRLLNRISQESKNYYRDYLDTVKQQIQLDYEQMAKDQQMDVEVQLKSRLKQIQEKVHMGLPIDENEDRRRREETQRFESRLEESTKEHDRLQNDYRILSEEMQHKRRALQELNNELRNKARKHAEQHARLDHDTSLARAEYYSLKDELDKLAYTLRFSVEEELKIYEALLNSFQRKKEVRLPPIDDSKYRQTTTRVIDTISSEGDSTNFRRTQPSTSETTRIFTTHTNIDDSMKYRPPPLLTETTRFMDTISTEREPTYRRTQPSTSESTRIFTTQTNIDDSFKYRPPPLLTDATRFMDTISSGGESTGFRRTQPNISETTRIFTTQANTDDSMKYRPPPLLAETIATTATTTKTIKQQGGNDMPTIRIEQAEEPSNNWTYETLSSGTTSSTRDESTDRDRSAERTIIPTRTDIDGYGGIQQSLLDQNRTTTTTTRTTRRFGHGDAGQQQIGIAGSRREQEIGIGGSRREQEIGIGGSRREQEITSNIPEVDEKLLQSKIHITRKYKGNILIKFVDVSGRFVEIENTGNQVRDLTGWYIERSVDGRRIDYTFPIYELNAHTSVRIYGNYHQRSSSTDDHQLQLIAANFYDWGNGKVMRTELFNRDDVGKALFEQTIRD